jgi:hypothetical protein
MRRFKNVGKDHLSALVLLVIGAGALGLGTTYDVGNLNRMGPGFVPVALGVMMVAVAIAIAVTATPPAQEDVRVDRHAGTPVPRLGWRGPACILAAVVAFVVLGGYGGLVPATFVTVFVAASGDRESTLKGSLALAAAVTVFGVAVFHYGLSLQLPLFQWGG